MKVWMIDECDFVAGATEAEVREWYQREILNEPIEEMQEFPLTKTLYTGETPGDGGETMSFAKAIRQHQKQGATFPLILCSYDL